MKNTRLSLPEELRQGGLLEKNLEGMRRTLCSVLGLKRLPIINNERVFQVQNAEAKRNQEEVSYPLSWLEPSDVSTLRDRYSAMAASRYGLTTGPTAENLTSVRTIHAFPIQMGFSLRYQSMDLREFMAMVEALLIISARTPISYDLLIGEQSFRSTIKIPDNVSIPLADSSDVQKPGAFDLNVAFILETYAGIVRVVDNATQLVTKISIIEEALGIDEEYEIAGPGIGAPPLTGAINPNGSSS